MIQQEFRQGSIAGRHHLLSKQGQGEEVRIQSGLRHFCFFAYSAFDRGGAQERQSNYPEDIQVFRGHGSYEQMNHLP